MGNVRVKLNLAAFNAIRNSEEVVAVLEEAAGQIQGRADAANPYHDEPGEPFRVNTVHNRTRAVTFVSTGNFDGILAEAKHRALSKGIG